MQELYLRELKGSEVEKLLREWNKMFLGREREIKKLEQDTLNEPRY